MNQIASNLATALKNPHIRWSIVGAFACEVGAVWLPAWKVQFQETQKLIGAYAVLAAANSAPQVPPAAPVK